MTEIFTWSVSYVLQSKLIYKHVLDSNKLHWIKMNKNDREKWRLYSAIPHNVTIACSYFFRIFCNEFVRFRAIRSSQIKEIVLKGRTKHCFWWVNNFNNNSTWQMKNKTVWKQMRKGGIRPWWLSGFILFFFFYVDSP